jgi:hypothetical protein
MKILAWNCRGLALAPTIRVLRAIIRFHRPDLPFLSEAKVPSSHFRFSLHGLGFVDMLEVPPVGSRGGIFLTKMEWIWNWSSSIVIRFPAWFSRNLFLLLGCFLLYMLFISFWTRMSKLGNSFGGAWLLMGGFNFVLSFFEKSGGRSFGSPTQLEFLDFVHSNALIDLSFVGNCYT